MKSIEKIINEGIKKEARQEALTIMQRASKEELDEFYKYYNNDSYNIVCLVIDKIKFELVKKGELRQNKDDHFGHFDFE